MFVKVDTSKVLPKEITFTKGGEQFTVKYYYPWLPARCKLCDKWGHGEVVCAQRGKGKKQKDSPGKMVSKENKEEKVEDKEENKSVDVVEAKAKQQGVSGVGGYVEGVTLG